MSDVENQPFFNIQRVYLKDMSLEQPNSPAIFLEQDMPSVEVEVDVALALPSFALAVASVLTVVDFPYTGVGIIVPGFSPISSSSLRDSGARIL